MEEGSMSGVVAKQVELAGLPRLRRRFESWRARKGSGEAIPQRLWQGAAALARRHGAGRIALELGLDAHKLKQISLGRWSGRKSKRARVIKAVQEEPGVTEVGAGPRFIELKAPAGFSGPLEGEAVMEVHGADGTRITLRLKDSSPALPVVIAALRGRP
jgi:hypothetical protein